MAQEKDFQKTVLPSRVASMALQSSVSSTKMDSQLATLELVDGSNVAARLVVRYILKLQFWISNYAMIK